MGFKSYAEVSLASKMVRALPPSLPSFPLPTEMWDEADSSNTTCMPSLPPSLPPSLSPSRPPPPRPSKSSLTSCGRNPIPLPWKNCEQCKNMPTRTGTSFLPPSLPPFPPSSLTSCGRNPIPLPSSARICQHERVRPPSLPPSPPPSPTCRFNFHTHFLPPAPPPSLPPLASKAPWLCGT